MESYSLVDCVKYIIYAMVWTHYSIIWQHYAFLRLGFDLPVYCNRNLYFSFMFCYCTLLYFLNFYHSILPSIYCEMAAYCYEFLIHSSRTWNSFTSALCIMFLLVFMVCVHFILCSFIYLHKIYCKHSLYSLVLFIKN